MIKKIVLLIGVIISLTIVQGFTFLPTSHLIETNTLVHWYTFGEAVELQKKSPRMIMVDVYTNWCGPCKMMSAYTFEHSVIAQYLNEHYYPVKFNAETRDSVIFNGNMFVNHNPDGTARPVHDFAVSILDNKLYYPSIVFLNEDLIKVQTVSGFYKADQFEPIIKFFGSGKYKDTKYDDYVKNFITEVK